ncbi:class I histocompatibility antigen, F10 alpha chain-like isoform X3 [Brienomyrus brachyistius]|uniref:class I histocompatibility antigen, F10 alpha chain-like isoform X3 n=1 Tax=Brienomyrus brachyistius TaxID=42636 RepID=UPI0020B26642|nr:class I histocompatibility antigen, F10 alpha chain-like isoform X3 [Brienomyrus brachyistius]
MESRVVVLMFTCFSMAGSKIHTLEYIYTALSKPVGAPGVYEFTAMGILDNEQIDYYNSKDKNKIPRQTWMSERLDGNYWDKGTSSRRSKEQWFKVNVEILMNRMNDSRGGLHVLQWRHGCQGEPQPDGTLAFLSGFDQYSYDGGDFLSFDPGNLRWIAPVSQAVPTKNKWDHSQTLNQYTEGYLKRECMDWLNKFMSYGEKDLKNQSPPEVFTRAKTAKTPGKLIIHCLATGSYCRDVEVDIYRIDFGMTEAGGVTSTGIRPSEFSAGGVTSTGIRPSEFSAGRVTSTGIRPSEFSADGSMAKTYQLKKSIEILESDLDLYRCRVMHRTLDEVIVHKWEPESDQGTTITIAVSLVLLIVCIVAIVAVFLVLRRRREVTSSGSSTTTDTEMDKEKLRNGGSNGSSSSSSTGSDDPLLNKDKSNGSSTSYNTETESK